MNFRCNAFKLLAAFALPTLIVGFSSVLAFAEEGLKDIAKATHANPSEKISNLTWKSEDIEVALRGSRVVALLDGTFVRENWNLLYENRPLKFSKTGKFRIVIPLSSASAKVGLTAIGPTGETEKENLVIEFRNYAAFKEQAKKGPTASATPSRFYGSVGAGLSLVSYRQTTIPDVSMKAITAKALLGFWISPRRWSVDMGGYYTAMVLSKTSAESPHFLGVNLRLGYAFPFVPEPWRLSLQGGAYYTTMMVTNNAFGFSNMAGPQLYPVLRRSFGNGNAASIYFKFSPVTSAPPGAGLFASREYAGGGSYAFVFKNGKSLSLTLDIASFRLQVESTVIQSTSTSFGTSFGF